MPSRWDLLLDQKPIPLVDHLLAEVAKLVARDLSRWPLPVEDLDLSTGRQFASLFAPDSKRPGEAVFAEAFRLARWELRRELDAYDDYLRNRRYLARGLAPDDRPALLLINRWLVEQMLSLGEATESRLKRPQMLECLDRIARHLALLGAVEAPSLA